MLKKLHLTGAGKKNEVVTNPTGIAQKTKIILIINTTSAHKI